MGIVIDLADLERLTKQYVAEEVRDGDDDSTLRQMHLSHFLLWLTRKKGNDSGDL